MEGAGKPALRTLAAECLFFCGRKIGDHRGAVGTAITLGSPICTWNGGVIPGADGGSSLP